MYYETWRVHFYKKKIATSILPGRFLYLKKRAKTLPVDTLFTRARDFFSIDAVLRYTKTHLTLHTLQHIAYGILRTISLCTLIVEPPK